MYDTVGNLSSVGDKNLYTHWDKIIISKTNYWAKISKTIVRTIIHYLLIFDWFFTSPRNEI